MRKDSDPAVVTDRLNGIPRCDACLWDKKGFSRRKIFIKCFIDGRNIADMEEITGEICAGNNSVTVHFTNFFYGNVNSGLRHFSDHGNVALITNLSEVFKALYELFIIDI